MKPKSTLRSFLFLAGSSLLAISSTQAADGTWTQTAAGPFNWGDIANWNSGSGPIASGQDSTAFFTADISAAQAVTLDSIRTLGTLVFDDLVSSHNLTISGANVLTLDRTTGVPVINVVQSGRTLTINSQISGGDGLRKIGLGSLTLGGTNDYTGGSLLSGGTLTLANTGSLTSGSALTFDSTATFNSIRLAAGSQTLGALTLNSGDATITSTAAGASSAATLTFGSLATRPVSATANFTLATNTTASTNKIVFSATANVPLASGSNDAGIFFGGSSYARYDAAGYVRAIIYGGADSNTNAALSGLQTTLGTISATTDVRFNAAATTTSTASAQAAASTLTVADGTLFNVGQAISGANITANTYITGITGNVLTLNQNTGAVAGGAVITPYTLVTGQTDGSVNTVLLSGAGASIRLADSQTLSVNGILRSGGTANVISTMTGGTGIQTATSGGELVFRTDVANDVVRVTTPILNKGGSSLTKSGAGTLTLTGNNTYTGSTTVNGGSLTMTGSNAYSGGTVINAGTLTISGDSALGDVNGDITFNGNGSLLVSAATTLASTRTITLNNGAIPYLGDVNINAAAPYLIINGKITGTGGIQASHYTLGGSATVAATRLASTANDFTGPVILGGNTNATYSAFVLETASLADSAGAGNIIFSNGRNNAADSATFQWGAGAITGLTLTHRQLEIATTSGTANVISGVSNINANAANTVVINTDLKVSTTSARTFLLGGTNTGANTFAGDIPNGVGAIGLTKDGGGTWVLSGNNTYTGATTLTAGTLSVGTTSNLGAAAANLVFNGTSTTAGGTLQITGTALTSFSGIGHAVSFTATRLVGLDIADAANTFTADQVLNQTTGGFTKTGAGTVALNQANTYTGITTAGGGLLKLDHATALPGGIAATLGTSNLTIDGGGIVGLTANSGDFNRGIGTLGTQVRWTGSGGFAAFGGTRTVLFSASSINWVATSFIGDTRTLILGSSVADGTVDWQQAISMAGGTRTVQVNNGSAAVDAIMSGRIAGGTSGTSNGFTKTGAGTLALTNNTNSYWGPTTVSNGTLRLGASNVLPNTNTNVTIAAATLDVGAGFTDLTGTGTLDVTAAATINLGDNASQIAFADSSAVDWTGGALNITGTFVSGSSIRFGTTSGGLTSVPVTGQLSQITSTGWSNFALDTNGYLTATPTGGNTAPTISDIANQSVPSGGTVGPVNFTVNDAETAVGSLTLSVSANSNPGLVSSIVFGGSGGSRTVTVTPVSGLSGTATITIRVTDGGALFDEDTFTLTVTDNYLSWATANGVTGGANGDHDNDGVKNLVEYALIGGGERGVFSGNTITYTKRGLPYGTDLTYIIETSETLVGAWTDAVTHGPALLVTNPTISYTFTPSAPVKKFARLEVVTTP